MVDSTSWWGSWGQEWVDAVKEKSVVTLQMVKKDLTEFVDVIQGDTSHVISETADKIEETIKNTEKEESTSTTVKQGLSKLLHKVSDLMIVEADDSQDDFITISDSFTVEAYSRKQEKLHAIQVDPATYCNEPEGLFGEWMEVFQLDDHKSTMSDLLIQNPNIRGIYTQLVPSVVSHGTFWQRYFYQVFLLESEEKRRENLLARVSVDEEVGDSWDDDDEDAAVLVSHPTPEDVSSPETTSQVANEASSPATESNEEMATESANTQANSIEDDDVEIIKSELPEEASSTENNPLLTSKLENDLNCQSSPISYEPKQEACVTSEVLKDVTDQPPKKNTPPNISETSSVGSWLSIDDEIKVKAVAGERVIKPEGASSKSSDGSSTVLVNKIDDLDDDFDVDLDEDINEEELAKMVQEIKDKSLSGGNKKDDDDDDWENWE